jgi:hypothetical protein
MKLGILVMIISYIDGILCFIFMHIFWKKPMQRYWRATLLGGFFAFVGAFGLTSAFILLFPAAIYRGFMSNLLWFILAVIIGVIAHHFAENSFSFFGMGNH